MKIDPAELIKKNLQPLTGQNSDYDSLLKMAENARFVLIGESTHGTKEFYKMRAELSKRLIKELNFTAVAIEGDWSDSYHINRYVNGTNHNGGAIEALENFERFPTWMWKNMEVLKFIKWLRGYNSYDDDNRSAEVRFYGLDLYGMNNSIAAVIDYLDKVDPRAGVRARQRYSCLDNFIPISPRRQIVDDSCEEKILQQLLELRSKAFEYIKKDGFVAEEEFFCAERNAAVVKSAHEYYRSLYRGEPSSWNLRDSHMANTLEELAIHLEKVHQKPAKIIVWAHNSHIGDARATEMSEREEINLGQIMRERHGKETLLIGFSTYQGKVSAASDWDMPVEHKTVVPALKISVERMLHEAGVKNFILNFRDNKELTKFFDRPILQRFIGVIYQPQTERLSHYYHANISKQFDALIYLDETTAVEPLRAEPHWHCGELDETYPFGM